MPPGSASLATEVTGAGGSFRRITIPTELIGGLMGRGGASITRIRKTYPHTTVKIDQPAGHPVATVTITGKPDVVQLVELDVWQTLSVAYSQQGVSAATARSAARGLPTTVM
mmetsp:Transcript_107620/g.335583  ORF Transcript_107620/g.335583 Transcript_107620/m.335583 type:complete len:112 (+) Transcript_107620:244-579(+)